MASSDYFLSEDGNEYDLPDSSDDGKDESGAVGYGSQAMDEGEDSEGDAEAAAAEQVRATTEHTPRVAAELSLLQASRLVCIGGVRVRESSRSSSVWVIGLQNFALDCEAGQSVRVPSSVSPPPRLRTGTCPCHTMAPRTVLQMDHALKRHAGHMQGAHELVEVQATFPDDYPAAPPVLRVVRPIFQPCTGGFDMGAPAMPVLFPEGWSSRFTMVQLLSWLRAHIAQCSPQLRWSTSSEYPSSAHELARARLLRRVAMPKISSMTTDRSFIAMSRTFAMMAGVMDSFPDRFEHSDKIELHSSILQRLTDDTILGTQALTFEVTAPSGVRVYCGASFSAPEENMAILPDWLWAQLHVPQCMEVQLKPVELPRAIALKLQAVSSSFAALEVDHSMVLQAALQNYTTLQPGLTIPVQVFSDTQHFLITSVTPEAAAVCPWVGSHWVDLGIKFDKPIATDLDVDAALISTADVSALPPAPPLTHQASTGTSQGSPVDHAGGVPLSRLPSANPALSRHSSQPGRWGPEAGKHDAAAPGAAADPSDLRGAAAKAAARHEADRAAFTAWRSEQRRAADAVALSAAAGERVQPFDEGAPAGKVRVDLFNPLHNPAQPPTATLIVNLSTTLAALYAHVRERFCPPYVPFNLMVRGRIPRELLTLPQHLQDLSARRLVPDTEEVTVQQAGLAGRVLEQQLQAKTVCDKTLALLAESEGAVRSKWRQEVVEAVQASEAGEDTGPISTYVINGGVLGLSQRYACKWLEELQRGDVPALQVRGDDLTLLKKGIILDNLNAELI